MSRPLSDTEKQRLVDVVAQSTRDGFSQVSPAELEVGWEKLERSLAAGKYPSVPIVRGYVTPWYFRGIVFVSMILGVGIVADWMRYQHEMTPLAPLRFVLEGSSVGAEQGIEAPADAPAQLVFSDRSSVSLSPKTKIAVKAMDSHGARITLAGGSLEVSVEPRQGSSWRFEAGPFTVAVKGTAFHLAFEAESGRLALQMHHGVVEVTGPNRDRRLTLGAGESLELFATAPGSERPEPAKATLETLTTPGPARPLVHRPRTRSAGSLAEPNLAESQPSESWSSMIARGEFDAVVKDAQDRGLGLTLDQAPASDLIALADAARYSRRADVARQALEHVRERFPDTSRSSEAAFFLGRLAEPGPKSTTSKSSSAKPAITWYETYLHESAQGPYAAEALGRELALYLPTDRARARTIARQYLERFPRGAQGDLARSLVQSSESSAP